MSIDRRVAEASAFRAFFQEHWQHLIELLGADASGELAEGYDSQATGEAIDVLVDGTDARVRAVYNHKKVLRAGTRALLEHIDSMIDRLPGALNLTHHNFIYDPQVSTFFTSMDEISLVCRESHEVSEYITASATIGSKSFFALLLMRYREEEIFGNELRGDVLQREVKQTSIIFTDHKILAPAKSEYEVKQTIKIILFNNVVEYLKLQLVSRHRKEMQMAAGHRNTIEDQMQSLNNPLEYLRTMVELLELPQDLIHLHDNTVRINRMGIKVSEALGAAGDDIHMQNIELGEGESHLLMLTEIPWSILDSENNK
jgi:hypothetical protein